MKFVHTFLAVECVKCKFTYANITHVSLSDLNIYKNIYFLLVYTL